jgi:hypothetical protein
MKMLLLALLLVAQRPTSPPLRVGTVTGRLLNEDGSPAAKIRVSAMSIPENRNETPALITLAETDSTGRYRLTDVPVGRYYIVAGFVDAPTYYPRGTGPTGATPVNVTANATVPNIDFRIERPSTGLTVSGRVIMEANPSFGTVQVMMAGGSSGGYTNLNVPVKLDGSFEFVRVRPGTYSITVNPSPVSEPRTVVVADKDVTGLELSIPWTSEVTGRVVVEGGGPAPTFNMTFSGGARQMNAYYQGSGQAFRTTVPEGFYVFTTTGIPSGFFLKSATSGGTDLFSSPLHVARNDLPSEIVVTLGVSTPPPWIKLSGRITGSRQAVSSLSIHGPFGAVTTPVSADGSFEFAKLLPGSYSVSMTPGGNVPAQPLTLLVPNRDVSGVELPLPSLKEISGRVIIEGGGPLPRPMLSFSTTEEQKRVSSSTPPSLAQLLVTTPNNRGAAVNIFPTLEQDGSFKASLPEGRYPVTATIQANGGSAPYSVKSFTYGSTDLTKEPLAIAATDSAEMRLTLSPTTTGSWVKVRGRVVGLTAASVPRGVATNVSLSNASFLTQLTAPVNPDGTFEFPRVYSGNYQARLNGVISSLGVPGVEVNVASADVTAVELVIPPQKEISGRILLEGRGAMPRLNLPLTVASPGVGFPGGQATYLNINPQADGTFKVVVPEGERQVGRPNQIPTGYTLKSVQYGSTDLAGNTLKVSAQDTAELRLTVITPDLPPVKVSGKVNGLDGAALLRGSVTLNLNDSRYASTLQTTVSRDGAFEFPAVFPGNYNVAFSPAVSGSVPAINVGAKDLTGIELNIPRLKEIVGRMVLEGSGPMPRLVVPMNSIASTPDRTATSFMNMAINPQPDGTFRVNMLEGERRAGPVSGLPAGYTVKAMTYGTVDLLSSAMKVTIADTAELLVTVSTPTAVSPAKVSGKVTGLDTTTFSGGPLNVTMSAPGYANTLQARISPDGSFQFPEVFPGNYSARVTGPGVAPHQPVTILVSNAEVRNVEIIVPGQKEITGRVIVEESAPLPRFNFRPTPGPAAQRSPLATQLLNITPGANGTFRLLLAEGERSLGDANGLPPGYTLKAATYGATDLMRDPLKVTQADTAELVFTLSAAGLKPVEVSGRVEGLDDEVRIQGAARVVMAAPTYAGNLTAIVRPNGTFEFRSVFPGTWVAQVISPGPGAALPVPLPIPLPTPLPAGGVGIASLGTAGVTVTVTDSDIRDLSLSVPKQFPIVGRVEIQGGGPIPRFPLMFSRPVTATGPGATTTTTTTIAAFSPQPNGTLRFTLPEGERLVNVSQLPPGLALKSITYGDIDLRQSLLKIGENQQTAELHVVLEKTQPTPWVRVAGKVTGLPSEVRNVRVSLTGTFNVPMNVPLNPDGTFTFEQVFQGTSSVRLIGNLGETLQTPVTITVGPKDVNDLEIVYRR